MIAMTWTCLINQILVAALTFVVVVLINIPVVTLVAFGAVAYSLRRVIPKRVQR